MDSKVLEATLREKTGKGPARRYRVQGYIPAVMYGYKGTKSIAVRRAEFESIFEEIGEHSIITLNLNDKEKVDVIVKDYQIDPVRKSLIHLDFLEIESGKELRTEIPIKIVGESKGVKKGGILEEFLREIEVECLPKDLPEYIELDISDLDLGDSFHVSDLKVKEGIKILSSPDQVILTIGVPSKVAAATETTEEEEEERPEEEESTEKE
ncbi:MAG: 50S ribosomal protein L25 [Spirochaetes bacterium]|nr:MAG: 50S ribosomal protein L25 [Spirochaetota bacterium]